MFDQPVASALEASRSVLVAGCGGGYDILGGIPIVLELWRAGKTVTVASLSFTRLDQVDGHEATATPHLFRATKAACTENAYCPEAWLSSWLSDRLGDEVPIWCFDNVGPQPLRRAYEAIVARHSIDTIMLIDGGVDSLLRGDETSLGTPSEDFSTLAAVSGIPVERKLLACVGMGAEMRDGISHAQVLERIAHLSRDAGFLGTWPLLRGSEAGAAYEAAASYVGTRQATQRGSHIHTVVAASMRGDFGGQGEHVWVSPLASLFWFFSLDHVVRQNLLLEHISEATTLWEVAAIIEAVRKTIPIKGRSFIPL